MPTTPSWKSGRTGTARVAASRGPVPGASASCSACCAHVALERLALAVDGVELLRQAGGARRIVGGQAGDASVMSASRPGSVQAQADRKPRSGCWRRRATTGDLEQRRQPDRQCARRGCGTGLRHQAPVVRVEPDDVGHGAERDQAAGCRCAAGLASKAPRKRAGSARTSASST